MWTPDLLSISTVNPESRQPLLLKHQGNSQVWEVRKVCLGRLNLKWQCWLTVQLLHECSPVMISSDIACGFTQGKGHHSPTLRAIKIFNIFTAFLNNFIRSSYSNLTSSPGMCPFLTHKKCWHHHTFDLWFQHFRFMSKAQLLSDEAVFNLPREAGSQHSTHGEAWIDVGKVGRKTPSLGQRIDFRPPAPRGGTRLDWLWQPMLEKQLVSHMHQAQCVCWVKGGSAYAHACSRWSPDLCSVRRGWGSWRLAGPVNSYECCPG